MTELMRKGSDTVGCLGGMVGFITAGISVDLHAVQNHVFVSGCHIPRMRPDGGGATPVGLAETGVEDVDIVHSAVMVTVVFAEVYLIVQSHACLTHHVGDTLVIAVAVIGAVPVDISLQSHRSIYVKFRNELRFTLPVAGIEQEPVTA